MSAACVPGFFRPHDTDWLDHASSPQSMIWPRALAQIAINKSLHNEEGRAAEEGNTAGWKISRLRFFLYCFAGMFLYYVSPGAVWRTPTRTRRRFLTLRAVVPRLHLPGSLLLQLDDLDLADQRRAGRRHWKHMWIGHQPAVFV